MASRILNYVLLTRYSRALHMQHRSIQEWRYKTYKGVWDTQTRRRERMKWKQRQMKMDENMKIDKKMKNMKAILRKIKLR